MKHTMKQIAGNTVLVLILLLGVGLLLFPQISVGGIQAGLRVCAVSILPVLFPFFVVTDLCSTLGYTGKLASAAAPITRKLFHMPGAAASSLTLGLIGGYPVGARTVVQQYDAGELNKQEAERLLLFCNNAGPAFILGVVGGGFFQSIKAGLALYLIHGISACILGVFFRPAVSQEQKNNFETQKAPTLASAFTEAAKRGGSTTLQVCVFILLFSVLNAFLSAFIPASVREHLWVSFLLASLELAGGLTDLSALTSGPVLFCICAFMLGWGGLCVYFQTMALLDKTDLVPRGYLCSKLFHGLISFVLAACAIPFMGFSGGTSIATETNPAIKIMVYLLIGASVLLSLSFLKKSSGKQADNEV